MRGGEESRILSKMDFMVFLNGKELGKEVGLFCLREKKILGG